MELEERITNRNFVIPTNEDKSFSSCCAVSTGVNRLAIFPSPHSASQTNTTDKGCDVVHMLRPQSWLYMKHTRQLVNESVGTFRSLQDAIQESELSAENEGDAVDLTPTLTKKCREYRSMLQACVCSLNASLDKEDPESDDYQEMAIQCQMLYKMELLLGLVEIIFIDGRPGSLILSQLVCWVRLHYTSCTEMMVTLLEQGSPSDHPNYWQVIYGLTCQGRLSETRQLLQTHHLAHTDSYMAMEELLRKMPTFQVYGGVSEAEFMLRWQHWQTECENRMQGGVFSAWGHLNKLAQILCGDPDTLLSVTHHLFSGGDEGGAWVPHMVATLLFRSPDIKLHRLHGAAMQSISECKVQLSQLDHLMLSAIEGDAMQVVRGSHQALDNMWLSAHLVDLLHHSLSARQSSDQLLTAMRDTIIQDYAMELADHSSLWQVGLIYLDYCAVSSLESNPLVSMLLERVPLTSDAKAHKVISIATQRNLPTVVESVCRVMGRQAAHSKRLSAAIWWGVRARDSEFTSHTAHQVLHRYLSSGEFQSSALLLDHLGPSMLVSDTLTFLGKYREFHTLCQKEDYKQAASLLVTLVSSKLAPRYFWPVLLLDALPLLQQSVNDSHESNDMIVSTTDTYELMYCLKCVVEEINSTEAKSHAQEVNTKACAGLLKVFSEKEEELRMVLAHNLARAIVTEGTVEDSISEFY